MAVADQRKRLGCFLFACKVGFLAIAVLGPGCAHMPVLERSEVAATPVPPESSVPVDYGQWIVAAQYDGSSGRRTGFNTFEVYLTNKGTGRNGFRSVRLDDTELPLATAWVPEGVTISVDGAEIPLGARPPEAEGDATWWQFYPTAEAGPGETVVFQINFKKTPAFRRRLDLLDDTGLVTSLTVPRFLAPQRRIRAVTYTLDYRRVFVQYESASAPRRLWFNGGEVQAFERMESPEPGTPHMLAFTAPFEIRTGMPLYVGLGFADGEWRHAMVRALNGVELDYRPAPELTRRHRENAGLDVDPPVEWLPYDVACGDAKNGKGSSAWPVISARQRLFEQGEGKLAGVDYCTATSPETWNIYGHIADAVYAKPYRLGWGREPARFLEEEEKFVEGARASAEPRPFLWIPEPFARAGRYLEAEELKVLGWMALARGAKGIRYHYRMLPDEAGFAACPGLLASVRGLNQEVRLTQELLSPLALVSERKFERPNSAPSKWFKTYTCWSGDLGLLVLVRNLNYSTDGAPDSGGATPRFRVAEEDSLAVTVALPEWLRFGGVRDALTGESVAAIKREGEVEIAVGPFASHKLLWLGDERKQDAVRGSDGTAATIDGLRPAGKGGRR